MSKIKSVNTKPELLLRKSLWGLGIRYRVNNSKLPGKPDILINKAKIIIFIDGEFWHGYNWEVKKTKIIANRDYWIKKIERNIERDINNTKTLTLMGYSVIRFWEHQIKNELQTCITKVVSAIKDNKRKEKNIML